MTMYGSFAEPDERRRKPEAAAPEWMRPIVPNIRAFANLTGLATRASDEVVGGIREMLAGVPGLPKEHFIMFVKQMVPEYSVAPEERGPYGEHLVAIAEGLDRDGSGMLALDSIMAFGTLLCHREPESERNNFVEFRKGLIEEALGERLDAVLEQLAGQ